MRDLGNAQGAGSFVPQGINQCETQCARESAMSVTERRIAEAADRLDTLNWLRDAMKRSPPSPNVEQQLYNLVQWNFNQKY